MISHLETSDLLIDCNEAIPKHIMVYRHELSDKVTKENISRGHRIYHAVGDHFQHVMSTSLHAKWMGALIFRLQDNELRANLMKVIAGWTPLHGDSKDTLPRATEPTPFTFHSTRRADPESFSDKSGKNVVEFFRAARAYQRNVDEVPLSKKKGVSCSQFVGFALKAAMLKTLFPLGFPNDIKTKLNQLQNKKHAFMAAIKSQNHEDKQDIINKKIAWFEEHKPELNSLEQDISHAITSTKDVDAFLSFLSEPIKGKNAKDFTKLIQNEKYQSIFSFVGKLGFVRESKSLDPLILTPPGLETFETLLALEQESNDKFTITTEMSSNDLLLSPDQLAQLEAQSAPKLK